MPESQLKRQADTVVCPEPYSPEDNESFTPILDTVALKSYVNTTNNSPSDSVVSIEIPAWHHGLEPEARNMNSGSQSVFISVIVAIAVLMLFNFNTLWNTLCFYVDELVKVRRGRDNVFDERPAAMSFIQLLLTLLLIICGGLLLAVAVDVIHFKDYMRLSPTGILAAIAIVGIYYMVELIAYSCVGYTFTVEEGRREWLRGFNASSSLLAIALVPLALFALFYPDISSIMAILAFILFILAKIIFILKGFRIFYDNFFSLLYFILYLCTLEIIPIILVYNCSVRFV